MSLCLCCRFGRKCPYMDGAEDFIHIMVGEDTRLQKLQKHIEDSNRHMEKKYRFKGPLAEKGLEVGIEIGHCEGFERLYI